MNAAHRDRLRARSKEEGRRKLAQLKEEGRRKLAQLGIKPAALGLDEAAAFCGLSTTQFLKEVEATTLPQPIGGLLCKRRLWSLSALEQAINARESHSTTITDDDPLMREIKSRAARKEVA